MLDFLLVVILSFKVIALVNVWSRFRIASKRLSSLYENYVVVSADKASHNIVFCKTNITVHVWYKCISKNYGNPTYKNIISIDEEYHDFPILYLDIKTSQESI